MERAWVGFAGSVVAVGLVVAGMVLVTWDVHVVEPGTHGSGRAFCGSAYDVVLYRGDGDMGGEQLGDESIRDARCVRRSGRLVVAGTALGTAGGVLGLGLLGVWLVRAGGAPLPGERTFDQREDVDL